MPANTYKVGKSIPSWRDGDSQTITFVVTEDCNLRCKYCYITHKASNKKMSFETAKKFIDYILADNIKRSEAVVVEFIGGEPFIEVELIDKISDYFKIRAFELDSDWYWNYRFNFSTNGVNYSDESVQSYIKKNYGKMSCGITLDGTKEKHDLQRVFPDGSGSYDTIIKNIGLWVSQFGGSTKVTFVSDDLKFLKDSILELWGNGILDVSANVVFEDVWKEGDDILFESQLMELADHILDNRSFNRYRCSLFDESLSGYYVSEDLNKTSCGAGKMMAVGPEGNIYPCIRYKGYSLNNRDEWVIGTVDDGIDMEKVRPFMTAMYKLQSDDECINCEVAAGCSFCQGFCYDEAETPTNFHRTKYICKMHKARVRANNYYFAKLFNRYGIDREAAVREHKRLYFLLSDDYVDYCQYKNESESLTCMSDETILQGLKYAHNNFFDPMFVHSQNEFGFLYSDKYEEYKILHIVPAKFFKEAESLNYYMLVFDKHSVGLPVGGLKNCMLNVEQNDIGNLFSYLEKLLQSTDRININIQGLDKSFDEEIYREQLMLTKDLLVKIHKETDAIKEVSLLTDLCFITEHNNCKAGEKSFAYGPDGKVYVCSAFYSDGANAVGDAKSGITALKKPHLYRREYSALCSVCDTYQCPDCVHLNARATNEVNVPPSYQCRKSYIEREVSRLYQLEIGEAANRNEIKELSVSDPMAILDEQNEPKHGYYVYKK